ncbi:MAG TPA: CRISPR-associated DxTHG motif protein [Arcobacter sp.]|nr:CRISPR-associated DxTHG motif protein [Arcobacter sp.]
MSQSKKAFISLLGMAGDMSHRGGVNYTYYYFSKSLQKEIGNLKKNEYPNMFPLVLENFTDYEHIAIATSQSKKTQKEILEYEEIDFKGDFVIYDQGIDYSDLLKKLNVIMEDYDKVSIDISHGFRHLPILSILALFNQNIKSQNKIEHIFLTKEIVQFKEYEIIDLKENFEIITFSYMLSSFNNNYIVSRNLQFSNRYYQRLSDMLSQFSKYFTSNLQELLQNNLIDEIIIEAKNILDMNVKDLEDEIVILIDNMKYIASLKDKSEWLQFYEFSKLMNLVDNYSKAIIFLNDSVGFYCLESLEKIKEFSHSIDRYKINNAPNRFKLINDVKNLVKLDRRFQVIDSIDNKKMILRYIENLPKIRHFQNFIRELEKLRNEVVHSSISLISMQETKNKYLNLLEAFETFCIRQDVLYSNEQERDSNTILEKDNIDIKSIKIRNYFSIKNIEITNLEDTKEVYFVGGNGDGKTILLQAIVLALKKEYSGQIIEYIRDEKEMELSVKDGSSNEYSSNKNIKNVFAYGINRNKVREKFDEYGYSGLFDTSDFKDTTFLKNPLELLKTESDLVQDFIDKLNQNILINNLKIEKDKNGKVTFKESKVDIDFETLSEGYKSTIIWICDLVARLIENQGEIKKIENFKAIVLIDEIDLYLHPKWKYSFVYNLRKVFPNIQFLMITHSTATILGASEDAVFYKVYKENGQTKISQPINSIKNLMANNLSTSPLFDMKTARARNSDDKLKTDEDYIYTKIHEIVSKQVQGKKAIIEDEIVDLINKELDDYIKEQGL